MSLSITQPLPLSSSRLTLLSPPTGMALEAVPAWAASRRQATGDAICVAGVVTANHPLHWMETSYARGWVLLQPSISLDGASLASAFAEQRARGFVDADAALLALARASGVLPRLSWGEAPDFPVLRTASSGAAPRRLGLYAIVDSAERLQAVLDAGVKTVQVRIKRPAHPDAVWESSLREQLARSIAAARAAGAELFVNDHADLALALGASAIHLGQEDLLALGDAGRADLVATGLALGVSSHSVWELCRARALPLRYIACGPVWATITKDMPWVPQGLDNLAWWARHAGAPVVGIGGILTPAQVEQVAACGADGVCLVRGLGDDPSATLPAYAAALERGRKRASDVASNAALIQELHPSLAQTQ
ncbi:MAG: thiamine phosphate synthase [Ramlibacter sp.]|uniref:thiamine phosphate synthase n=1 Tax=Ramlibacter sp. TaxID=1917967 RepID=UPI0026356CCC|nr:thiamine phosphate synthase [Ramlibacter sp.]MDH4378258.1 thiamine phosphate synthase [Ramlibacter sp.]